MATMNETIHTQGRSPTPEYIEQEKKGQLEALKQLQHLLAEDEPAEGPEHRRKRLNGLSWARGLWPDKAPRKSK